MKILSTRSKFEDHNKKPEGGQVGVGGGLALLYYLTSPKTLGFHTREKPLLVIEVAILNKPYDGMKCR